MDLNNRTIGSILAIKTVEKTDEGLYTCVIKQNYEIKQNSKLVVFDNDEDNVDVLPYDLSNSLLTSIDKTKTTLTSDSTSKTFNESVRENHYTNAESFSTATPIVLDNICQEYVGNVCATYLKAKFVYIPYDTTQAKLEDKLYKAIQVTKYSKDISSHCHGYALPSLCYSTFPMCRNPFSTNENFLKEEIKRLYASFNDKTQGIINSDEKPDKSRIKFENLSQFELPAKLDVTLFMNITGKNLSDIFNYRHNSTVLRRVCKQDCEILENELCQTEYAIAKRHPHIGQQLTLEECEDLPETDEDCLKIGIDAVMVADDKCFLGEWQYILRKSKCSK
ncbi:Tyrosine-protein kinase transmembrane receptor Ror [Eumeta japonica]|uniref:Tyrosine-protein kinase transmembrane receptor Ror n=1 Tax=Eumeta variegata TaxID=151549 RepID=A0A4C1UYU6_EUMVA|nr:Tyrosine-protein kinase transmembrane receptor Ror [Eumeta japonica]